MKTTVGTTAVQLDFSGSPDVGRAGQHLLIQNLHATVKVYLGEDNTVAAATGYQLAPAGGSVSIPWNGADGQDVWAIADGAGGDVRSILVG